MIPGTVDYAASYFKYKTPTPIHSTPTNSSLKRLKLELRTNAASVESELGKYLGLVSRDAECAAIALTLFVAPAFPGNLVVPAGTDAIQALNLQEQHVENTRKYYKCKNVEKALL